MIRTARIAFVAAAAGAATMSFLVAQNAQAAPKMTDAQLIANAASAAPASIGHNATVIATDGAGRMRPLRRGTNGWTCMPDDPNTPANDPMCVDSNGMLWAQAWMGHKVPPADKPGLAYMLTGAADASNTDPYATKPARGASWVRTGPHIMILDRNAAASSGYPGGPSPDTSKPYVMFAGTPYAHIMMPVR
ncbi:MAG TPA: hypothetical protein VH331_13915 [Allosphingosinicella sp.]|jgi:hypothetical protein|nr:hypothetical protein [Allosphingosinicella sp.]